MTDAAKLRTHPLRSSAPLSRAPNAGGAWAARCWAPRSTTRARPGHGLVEGYPVDTRGQRIPSATAFTGTLDLFEAAGFRRISERVAGRPLVQLSLE